MAAERLKLPSGGWWDLETAPTWGQVKILRRRLAEGQRDGSHEIDEVEEMLLALTVAWSYGPAVTAEALAAVPVADVVPALALMRDRVLPLFLGLG